MKKTEHEIQNEIRLLLGRRPDIRIFRANVGQAWTGERIERRADGSVIIRGARPFSTGLPAGWPDLFGFRAVTVTPELVGAALPVSTAMELAQARADSAGIKLVCTVESDPKIKADVQLLEQAVLNLIDNAIKHSGESREIRIRVGEEEGEAFIEVSDHGCGIPAEHLPRLFERFYRVDKARSRKAGGTGLGLAIVKHIMQLHRGRAEVKSRVGEGSTFTLRLPVAHS